MTKPTALKHKGLYLLINAVLLLSIILLAAVFSSRPEIFGIPAALFFLFHGLWPASPKCYSWFQNKDADFRLHFLRRLYLIGGVVMSVLLLVLHLLLTFG